jgi:hypothetical protein
MRHPALRSVPAKSQRATDPHNPARSMRPVSLSISHLTAQGFWGIMRPFDFGNVAWQGLRPKATIPPSIT